MYFDKTKFKRDWINIRISQHGTSLTVKQLKENKADSDDAE